MSPETLDWWFRAKAALNDAEKLLEENPDGAASRAYYAAFFAVSALFSDEGKSFTKHSAVEAAVHRDLVRAGRWPPELGAAYTSLSELRHTGNYGGKLHVTAGQATAAIDAARRILAAVQQAKPDR